MIIQNSQKREIFLRLANIICKKYSVDINKLYKRRRGKKNIVRCKLILFYILKTLFTCTQKELYTGLLPPIYFTKNPIFLREIAKSFNKSHCNILHATKAVNGWIDIYQNDKQEIEKLHKKCQRYVILFCSYNNIDYTLYERK